LADTPALNHWWNIPLSVSATGLTTSLIPHVGGDSFQVDFDLSAHELVVVTVSGSRRSLPLRSAPIVEFYRDLMLLLEELAVATRIWPFLGKASPVHLFWGALDLATTRFSGRPAPPHPGGAPNCGPRVMLEPYSHEVSSLGYWPGGDGEGTFYSYDAAATTAQWDREALERPPSGA
jgi:hypothetical protein